VNKDVVFNDMVNWYSLMKVAKDEKAKNGEVSSNVK
jgi:hypothetical protein